MWVHPAYPETQLIRVARTFAWSRLSALMEAMESDIFSEEEIEELWENVKPSEFMPK